VLFVGALGRHQNEDAVRWLLGEIWPQVVSAVPDAELTVAGGGASPALEEEMRRAEVRATGYVEVLGPEYERAAVVVAPLRLGAGIKLKCVTAMLWGVPVVATSVGAEGLGGTDLFVAIEDSSEGFASALVDVLRRPERGLLPAATAFRWAHSRFTSTAYRRALEEVNGLAG
jgi:glycosyltransferase involved in cell wall biosynthesis